MDIRHKCDMDALEELIEENNAPSEYQDGEILSLIRSISLSREPTMMATLRYISLIEKTLPLFYGNEGRELQERRISQLEEYFVKLAAG